MEANKIKNQHPPINIDDCQKQSSDSLNPLILRQGVAHQINHNDSKLKCAKRTQFQNPINPHNTFTKKELQQKTTDLHTKKRTQFTVFMNTRAHLCNQITPHTRTLITLRVRTQFTALMNTRAHLCNQITSHTRTLITLRVRTQFTVLMNTRAHLCNQIMPHTRTLITLRVRTQTNPIHTHKSILPSYGFWPIMVFMEIDGTTAIITGSSGKVGRGIAFALGNAGCRCICHYHNNRAGAEEVVAAICKDGGRAVAVGADLTKADEIGRLFADFEGMGRARILVNSAGVFERGAISEVTFENSGRVLGTNLVAPVMVSARFAEVVGNVEADSGPVASIVNIADIGGIRPWANYTMYCASKAGLIAATKSMAKELAPGICVNAVAPGVITWPTEAEKEEYDRQVKMIPAGRVGTCEEIAAAVLFLLRNDYITGQVLNVDGGRCI